MSIAPILAMVRKDLLLFCADRRAVIVAFAVPIAIASFFGSLFKGNDSGERARTKIASALPTSRSFSSATSARRSSARCWGSTRRRTGSASA